MVQNTANFYHTEDIVVKPENRLKPLYIKKCGRKGLGVFCSEDIKKDSIIEICPIIFIPEQQANVIDQTILRDYYYYWYDGTGEHIAITLGYGSLYNHSYNPNAIYCKDYKRRVVEIKAIKDIPANTEITVNYNGDPNCKDPVWFGEVLD